jgi:hypothetical protein
MVCHRWLRLTGRVTGTALEQLADFLLGSAGNNPQFQLDFTNLVSHVGSLDIQEALILLRRSVLSAACNIWWRCEFPIKQVPFSLLCTAAPDMQEHNWLQAPFLLWFVVLVALVVHILFGWQVYRQACSLAPCCVDRGFTPVFLKLLRDTPENEWWLVRQALAHTVSRCKLGNFEIECCHRQVSDSTASKRLGKAKSMMTVSAESLLRFMGNKFTRLHPGIKTRRHTVLKSFAASKAGSGAGRACLSGYNLFTSEVVSQHQLERGQGLSCGDVVCPLFLLCCNDTRI